MAKKSKKARKGKKPNYKQGWETRRRNALLASRAATLGGAKAEVRKFVSQGTAKLGRAAEALRADHVKDLIAQAKADGERSLLDDAVQSRGQPGRGEIVGGADAQLAERIIALARKRGSFDAVQSEIMALRGAARYEGCVETDKDATKRLIEVQQIQADRVVCGFIAEVDHAMQFHRGLPPAMTWLLNSFTVVKIVDALQKAGYSARGRSGEGEKVVGA